MSTDCRVTLYEESQADVWDGFVERSFNGTVFHSQRFLGYHRPDSFDKKDLLVWNGEDVVGVMPLALSKDEKGRSIYSSPYGASYGGLVVSDAKFSTLCRMREVIVDFLKGEDDAAVLRVTFPPSCYAGHDDISPEYFFLYGTDWKLRQRRITSAVPLKTPIQISKNISRNSKKAKNAGLHIKENGSLDEFYPILKATIEGKHGASITHTLDELKYLFAKFPDRMSVTLGSIGGEACAGVLCMHASPRCVMAFYNAHLTDAGHPGALSAVFMHLIDRYKAAEHVGYLDLGASSTFSKPLNEGLLRFKQGLSAVHYYRDTYEIEINGPK